MIERTLFKSQCKRLFNLSGGICYLKIRGSIYFLAERKYESIELLRKVVDYETQKPTEFYNIIHDNYLKQCETTQAINKKKQGYYAERRLQVKYDKIEKLRAEIKIIEENLK